MLRLSFLTLLLGLSFSSLATHIFGIQVYWDALGNDQYVFHVEMLRDNASGSSNHNSVNMTIDGNSYNAPWSSTQTVSGNCGSGQARYHIDKYTTQPITLVIPTNGFINVSSMDCCMHTLINVQGAPPSRVESKMYAAGTNRSSVRFDLSRIVHSTGAKLYLFPINPSMDLVHVNYARLLGHSGQFMTYNTGYSYQYPTSPNDLLTPAGVFTSGSLSTGLYGYSFVAEQTNPAAQAIADIQVTFSSVIPMPSSNDDPAISVTNPNGTWNNSSAGVYEITALAGDNLSLDISASDNDLDANFTPQSIYASISGNLGVAGNPSLTPVAPQTSLVSSLNNNVNFSWSLPTTISSGDYYFNVSFTDNNCPIPGLSSISLRVHVPADTLDIDTFSICHGGSVQLTAPISGSAYIWSPPSGLSSMNTMSTTASPSVSTTYSVTVDGDMVGYYTVLVAPSTIPLLSQPQPNQLEITNVGQFQNHAFLFYYIPFGLNGSPVTITSQGLYHGIGQVGNCIHISDSIIVSADSSAGVYMISDPVDQNDFANFDDQSNYEMDFKIGQSAIDFHTRQIILPGATATNGSSVQLKITDDSGIEQTVPGQIFDYYIQFDLASQAIFHQSQGKLILEVISGTMTVPMAPHQGLPYNHGIIHLDNVQGNIGNTTLQNEFIPFVFNGFSALSQNELVNDYLIVYPQPAKDIIKVEGFESNSDYQIVDMNGRTLQSGRLDADKITVSDLPAGVYILQMRSKTSNIQRRILIQ